MAAVAAAAEAAAATAAGRAAAAERRWEAAEAAALRAAEVVAAAREAAGQPGGLPSAPQAGLRGGGKAALPKSPEAEAASAAARAPHENLIAELQARTAACGVLALYGAQQLQSTHLSFEAAAEPARLLQVLAREACFRGWHA